MHVDSATHRELDNHVNTLLIVAGCKYTKATQLFLLVSESVHNKTTLHAIMIESISQNDIAY